MIIAPIIHTRTFSCDFNSEFLVKPSSFKDSDIKWARKNILGATEEIDSLQGFRWLIADNEKYRIAGVVGFLKNIYSKVEKSLSEDDKLKSKELFCDNKDRLVYAFIGIVIDKNKNNNNYGTLTFDYLWNIYLNKIYPIWKSSYQEIIFEDFIDIEVKHIKNNVDLEKPIEIDSRKFFESNAVTDYELFSYFLCNKYEQNFSFCSNVSTFSTVKQSKFTIITTSKNIITRIERENTANLNSASNEQTSMDKSDPKKKNFLTLMIGLMILLIIILTSLLVMKNTV